MSLFNVAIALLHRGSGGGLSLVVKIHRAYLMDSFSVLADPRQLQLELCVAVGRVFVDAVDDLGALIQQVAGSQIVQLQLLDFGFRCLLRLSCCATEVAERNTRRLDAVHLSAVLLGPCCEDHADTVRANG